MKKKNGENAMSAEDTKNEIVHISDGKKKFTKSLDIVKQSNRIFRNKNLICIQV